MSDAVVNPLGLPYPDSYWVVPGKFLAGEYPGAALEDEARARLTRLLNLGIDFFIDLTREAELDPYELLVLSEAQARGRQIHYNRLPVTDFSIPTQAEMVKILDTIDRALAQGRRVYLHCWGGIGRTGTAVGCYLVRHGLDGASALERLAVLRRGIPFARPSPETLEQARFVLNWQIGQ